MKYTIEGLNQQVLVDNSLNSNDVVFLRWFIDYQATGRMKVFDDEAGNRFYWIKHSVISEELPILGLNKVDSVNRYLARLVKKGILYKHIIRLGRDSGTNVYYRIDGDLLYNLTSKGPVLVDNSEDKTEYRDERPGAHRDERPGEILLQDSSINACSNAQQPEQEDAAREGNAFDRFPTAVYGSAIDAVLIRHGIQLRYRKTSSSVRTLTGVHHFNAEQIDNFLVYLKRMRPEARPPLLATMLGEEDKIAAFLNQSMAPTTSAACPFCGEALVGTSTRCPSCGHYREDFADEPFTEERRDVFIEFWRGEHGRFPKDFERFWKAYPRQEGKRSAFGAWLAALVDHPEKTPADILRAAKIYAYQTEDREQQFIKKATTFFADEWLDLLSDDLDFEPPQRELTIGEREFLLAQPEYQPPEVCPRCGRQLEPGAWRCFAEGCSYNPREDLECRARSEEYYHVKNYVATDQAEEILERRMVAVSA